MTHYVSGGTLNLLNNSLAAWEHAEDKDKLGIKRIHSMIFIPTCDYKFHHRGDDRRSAARWTTLPTLPNACLLFPASTAQTQWSQRMQNCRTTRKHLKQNKCHTVFFVTKSIRPFGVVLHFCIVQQLHRRKCSNGPLEGPYSGYPSPSLRPFSPYRNIPVTHGQWCQNLRLLPKFREHSNPFGSTRLLVPHATWPMIASWSPTLA